MNITNEIKDYSFAIKDYVSANYKTAGIFEKYGIDYCCNGNRDLETACKEKNIDFNEISQKLKELGNKADETAGYNEWDIYFLADYIINTHHAYVKKMIPVIKEHLVKIAGKHGENHPEIYSIKELFSVLGTDLLNHLQKEEKILFPIIKEIANFAKEDSGKQPANRMSIQGPVTVMESEHAGAGEILEKMKLLSDNYTAPSDGCTTYKVTFQELNDFEKDLHKHIFLENSILFPKAIRLEVKLRA